MKTIETINTICQTNSADYRAQRDELKKNIETFDRMVREAVENFGSVKNSMKQFVKEIGPDAAVVTVASLINREAWDGRIDRRNAEWAEMVEDSWNEEAMTRMGAYTMVHRVHLNQAASYIRTGLNDMVAEIAAEQTEEAKASSSELTEDAQNENSTEQTEVEIPEADINEAVAEEVETELADNFTITENGSFGSIEISFTEKPSEAVRDALKAMRFRWHGQKRVWYGYRTEEEAKRAIRNAQRMERGEAKQTEQKQSKANKSEAKKSGAKKPAAKKSEPVNDYGVKVGDLFYSSWGYEQTNVDFFQVVELVGKTSVRVREVYPPIIEDKTYQHGMAADRVYQTSGCGILEPAKSSVFIKDQVKGDLKRIKSYGKRREDVQFNLSSFANAYLCGDKQVAYESWYY